MQSEPSEERQGWCVVIVAFLFAIASAVYAARGATVNTTPANLQGAINSAANGDTLIVSDGTAATNLNFGGKSDLTVRAANTSGAVIQGRVELRGSNRITLRGLVIEKAATRLDDAMIRPGTGTTIEDCDIRDGQSIGVAISGQSNVTVRRTKIHRNGSLGLNCGDAGPVRCDNLTLEDLEIYDNNYGIVNPVWAGDTGKAYLRDGKWYRNSFDEGGGMKLTRLLKGKVTRCRFWSNGGPGAWTDVDGDNVLWTDCESFQNHPTPGAPNYEGIGFMAEISQRNTFVNCYAHDNVGSGFAVDEAPYTTLTNCVMSADHLEFRDIQGRGLTVHDVLVENLRCYNGSTVQSFDPAKVVLRNVQFLSGNPVWTPTGGTTPPPPPPPDTPPGPVSPSGTVVTGPGTSINDAAGYAWTITADRKIARNGAVQAETSAVSKLVYVNGAVYQQATPLNLWWKWTGAAWLLSGDPGAVVPPPPPPPSTDVAVLQQQLAALQAELAAVKAKAQSDLAAAVVARDAAIASGAVKDATIAGLNQKIAAYKAWIASAPALN